MDYALNHVKEWSGSPMLSRFGKNPYGDNMYRIVWGGDRTHTVVTRYDTGSSVSQMLPLYPPEMRACWVLECWMPPYQFAGCSSEEWYANPIFNVLGPYPQHGEYDACHFFEVCGPTDANIDKLIKWIEEGRKRTFAENRRACQEEYDREQTGISGTMQDMIGNKLPAFGIAPMSGPGGGRGSKTMPILETAQHFGLPTMKAPPQKQLVRSSLFAGNRKPKESSNHA